MTKQQPQKDDDGLNASGWWGRFTISAESLSKLLDYMGPALPYIAYAVAGSMLILSLFLGWSWVQ